MLNVINMDSKAIEKSNSNARRMMSARRDYDHAQDRFPWHKAHIVKPYSGDKVKFTDKNDCEYIGSYDGVFRCNGAYVTDVIKWKLFI